MNNLQELTLDQTKDSEMKEWKGNKNSVRVMNGDRNNPDRAFADYYTTDPAAVEEFLKKTPFFFSYGDVWEPACGCGNISMVLEKHFDKVYSSDLFDRGYGVCGVDFLKTDHVPGNTRYIITNPPYALCDQFILHAMDILPDGGYYIALLNINYLAGIKRYQEIYSKYYLHYVFVYRHRINCYKNNENTGHSSPVNYAWFCFKKSKDIGTTSIHWL